MGTSVRIVAWAPDRTVADAAVAGAYAEVARLDSLFSDYRDDSGVAELARAAGTGPVPAAPELVSILGAALEWSRVTGGAFDVTVGPATREWRRAMRRGELPPPTVLDSIRALVGGDGLDLDAESGTVALVRRGMSLDLGGIAKGWIADRVLARLRDAGIASALVDAGGDLALGAAPPDADGWRVEFPGGEVHEMSDVAVATSGDRYQFLEVGGVRYSHILDPRTAIGLIDAPTVVVVAGDATTADVLASALGGLPPARVRALVDSLGTVAVRIVPRTTGVDPWSSEGFPVPLAVQERSP